MSATSYVLALPSLIAYFKCDEGPGSTAFKDYISVEPDAVYTGTIDPDVKALTLNTEQTTHLYLGVNASLSLAATIAMGTTFTQAFLYNGDFTADTVLAKLDDTHYLASVGRKLSINMGGTISTSLAVALTDHRTHLIGITANAGAGELSVDGVVVHTFSLIGTWDVAFIGTSTAFSGFSDNLATVGEVLFTTAYTSEADMLKLYNNIMVDSDTITSFVDHTHALAGLVNCRYDSIGTSPKDYAMNVNIMAGEHRRTSQTISINRGDPEFTKSILYEQTLQAYTKLDIAKTAFCRGVSIWFKNVSDTGTTLGLMTLYNDAYTKFLTLDGGPVFPTFKTEVGTILPTNPIVDNAIHNIMIIQDNVNLTLYIDGIIDKQTAGIYITDTYENVITGATFDTGDLALRNYTDLVVGDFLMFNTMPTQAEITAYVTAGKAIEALETITETVTIDFYRVILGLISEIVSTDASLANVVNITVTQEEIANFQDAAGRIQKVLIAEGFNLPITDIAVDVLYVYRLLTEDLTVTGAVQSQISVIESIIAAFVIWDEINSDSELVIESFGISAVLARVYNLIEQQVESVLFDSALAETRYITLLAEDSVALDDTLSTSQIISHLLHDSFKFVGGLDFDGDSYIAYVVNSRTTGLSEYDNFNFNSMSENLAASSTGIYALTGADDNGEEISASIKTGLFDFGQNSLKQVPYAYLGIASDGRMAIKVSAVNNGNKKERWYELRQTNASAGNTRIKLGKGVKARYWQFELANMDGSDFEVEDIDITPIVLKRRIGS